MRCPNTDCDYNEDSGCFNQAAIYSGSGFCSIYDKYVEKLEENEETNRRNAEISNALDEEESRQVQKAQDSKVLQDDAKSEKNPEGLDRIEFDGNGNCKINAAGEITLAVGGAVLKMNSSGNIILDGDTRIILKVGGSKIEIDTDTITIESENIKLEGKKIKIIGERTEIGKAGGVHGMLINKSGNTYINGNSKVRIKGGKVDIN